MLAGIRVTRRVLGAFVASGAIASLAGVLYASRYGTLDAVAGNGIELRAVSAVVVGGVAIFGGSGTVWGAALGALLLATIRSALRDPAGQPLLGAGHQRRAAPARHRPRRLAGDAIGPRTAQEELAPCLDVKTNVEGDVAGGQDHVFDLKRLGRWETVTVFLLLMAILYGATTSGSDFLSGGNLNSILSDMSEIAIIALPLTPDHHRRGDRPVGRLGARA